MFFDLGLFWLLLWFCVCLGGVCMFYLVWLLCLCCCDFWYFVWVGDLLYAVTCFVGLWFILCLVWNLSCCCALLVYGWVDLCFLRGLVCYGVVVFIGWLTLFCVLLFGLVYGGRVVLWLFVLFFVCDLFMFVLCWFVWFCWGCFACLIVDVYFWLLDFALGFRLFAVCGCGLDGLLVYLCFTLLFTCFTCYSLL